ncbi:TrbI/VirB10 family protein [Sphingomonas nostoxanthinifaciens]|uniref:TrbI/VirB10 family protein n=1 Tax=Sphingomonas nostoxanthinifaciens TaxID=2872652 RepID=UPI001CC1E8CE|nr:TrbI/VirB10 family protein [Sphingomonas nostoxanthinifaciens]UAK23259.1 hypothetical protein K8P63_12675 [Sphingomonas nostoxanthinifaciens]
MTAEAAPPVPEFGDALVAQPSVVGVKRRGGMFGYGVVGVMGIGVLIGMSASRHHAAADLSSPASAATIRFTKPDPLPTDAVAAPAVTAAGAPVVAASQVSTSVDPNAAVTMPMPPMPAVTMTATPGTAVGAINAASRLAAPAVVVDLGEATAAAPTKLADKGATLANPALAGANAGKMDATIGDDDSFIKSAGAKPDQARATRMGKLDSIISEGTIISAALETAVNSDLPGLARAVISRDVMSFDGTTMLIPRGSRVIGQYKSGVQMGASRVFVIWTRLIRPDGVSIQLISPGGDDLGRGGVGGKVDRHFLQRYGGAVLTTLLSGAIEAGVASVASGNLPVYVNQVAQTGTSGISQTGSTNIAPTIKVPQGSSIKIFVARDLDFTGMEQGK